MFILLDKSTGGVYAVTGDDGNKVVQIFVDKDDAVRYYGMLEAVDYKRPLEVTEVEEDIVIDNCSVHNYNYAFINPEDLVIPPLSL